MTINPALFSSKETGDHHATPKAFYDQLDAEFSFRLDPCSSVANHQAPQFFALDHPDVTRRDGLAGDWTGDGAVFMNPPYGATIGEWMTKAKETAEAGTTVVCLVPARTDTRWFHDTVVEYNAEVRFVKGRLHFGGQKNAAPFPSIVVVFYARPTKWAPDTY